MPKPITRKESSQHFEKPTNKQTIENSYNPIEPPLATGQSIQQEVLCVRRKRLLSEEILLAVSCKLQMRLRFYIP